MPVLSHGEPVVIRFFSRMTHMFGHKWASVYGEAMLNGKLSPAAILWAQDLSRLTLEQITHGIDAIYALTPEWPPNPMDFIRLATAAGPQDWKKTSTGIEAKGKELGLKPSDFEHFPAFKAEVFKRAGGQA